MYFTWSCKQHLHKGYIFKISANVLTGIVLRLLSTYVYICVEPLIHMWVLICIPWCVKLVYTCAPICFCACAHMCSQYIPRILMGLSDEQMSSDNWFYSARTKCPLVRQNWIIMTKLLVSQNCISMTKQN